MNENTGYLTLDMIDDRMALDPVEFMPFASKRHQRALFPPIPMVICVEEKDLWKGGALYAGSGIVGSPLLPLFSPSEVVLLFGQWHHRKSTVILFPGCAGRRLMHFILKSSRRVRTRVLMLKSMAVGPNKVFQGFSESLVLVLVPESPDEGFEDEPPPDPVHVIEGFKEQPVLVLASEPIDEGFEEEAPPDPVSGEFKEQLVLVLVSEGSSDFVPLSSGPVGSVPVSEGSPDSTPVYEAPGSQPVYEAPGSQAVYEAPASKSPEFHKVSGGHSTLSGRPPDLPH
ncbi:hypothetical protein CHARACLAT_015970 [Characodon lateralis]|uniref:Uncharacterized protein n=1 Tax=Characodon lateralis TaxID=208331 RepID=A0ABU7DH15_9TELE|nr:hypothetical protein [Characodon lateralis]